MEEVKPRSITPKGTEEEIANVEGLYQRVTCCFDARRRRCTRVGGVLYGIHMVTSRR
jgi:hypothetical protein